MATCSKCGQPVDDDEDEDECDLDDCNTEEESTDLAEHALSFARPGNEEEFKRQIEIAIELGGYELNIVDEPINEANDAAARGDVSEARRLLDRAVNPKWDSEAECRTAYDAAMAEKRGVAA